MQNKIVEVAKTHCPECAEKSDEQFSSEAAITLRQSRFERKLLSREELGRRILRLREEQEELLDTVWLATSSVQTKELWSRVSTILNQTPASFQQETLNALGRPQQPPPTPAIPLKHSHSVVLKPGSASTARGPILLVPGRQIRTRPDTMVMKLITQQLLYGTVPPVFPDACAAEFEFPAVLIRNTVNLSRELRPFRQQIIRGQNMAMSRLTDRCRSKAHTRRKFLAAAGVGCLSLMAGRMRAADELKNETSPPKFLLEWGHHGKGDGEFDACVGIAIGPNNEVYTAEFLNQRVQKFSPDGKFLGGFSVQPHAGGLAVDADGVVYVAHWNSNKVAAYSVTGTLIREWGQKGTGDGEFQLPGSIALGPDDLLYVPDQGNSRVQKFTKEGKFIGKFGEHGKEPGQFGGGQPAGGRFAGPQFVAFDRRGHVYTTDAALDRIQKFSSDGQLLDHWGSENSEPGGFGPPPLNNDGTPGVGGPIAICVDRHDRVWVSATNNRVQQFTNGGRFLCGLGGEGSEPGQFHLPHGIVLDSSDNLYVADTMNTRIQKFAVN